MKKDKAERRLAGSLIILIMFGSMLTLSCQDNGALMTSKKDLDVVLISGTGNDEVTWHIKNVKRSDQYMNETSREIKNGEAITIEGESDSKSLNTPFFSGGLGKKTKPIFILLDPSGNQYRSQMEDITGGIQTAEGGEDDDFTVAFGITDNGTGNEAIKKWGDLTIADPDENSSKLPGHKVSLSAFDIETGD